jgi:hypothetical protein
MAGSGPRFAGAFFMTMGMDKPHRSASSSWTTPERERRGRRLYLAGVIVGFVIMAGLFLAGCDDQPSHSFEKAKRSTNIEDVRKVEKPKTAVLINGLGVYGKPGMMGSIKAEFERRGWKVTILNHTEAKRMTSMPRVLVGHSKGGNSGLRRSQAFKKNAPELIVTIDPGRWPQWVWAETKARVVNIRCWYHPIGGEAIIGAAKEYEVCGTDHLVMPHDKRVLDIIFKEVEALR